MYDEKDTYTRTQPKIWFCRNPTSYLLVLNLTTWMLSLFCIYDLHSVLRNTYLSPNDDISSSAACKISVVLEDSEASWRQCWNRVITDTAYIYNVRDVIDHLPLLFSFTFAIPSDNCSSESYAGYELIPPGTKMVAKLLTTVSFIITWMKVSHLWNGPFARYVKLRVAHAPGMPWTFSPVADFKTKPLVSDPGMHHGTCVTHVSWCMSGSLTRDGGENVPGIPGACATRYFTYLARGPWFPSVLLWRVLLLIAHHWLRSYDSSVPKGNNLLSNPVMSQFVDGYMRH